MSTNNSVAVFWDYENCAAPASSSGYELAANIRNVASKFGVVKAVKAYLAITQCSESRRSQLQASGVSLIDCPHNGRKEVADKMILVDMLAYAIDTPSPATIFLISGDRDFSYAISILRQRGYDVVLAALPNAHISLTTQASTLMDWSKDVVGIKSASALPIKENTKETAGAGDGKIQTTVAAPSGHASPKVAQVPTTTSMKVTDSESHKKDVETKAAVSVKSSSSVTSAPNPKPSALLKALPTPTPPQLKAATIAVPNDLRGLYDALLFSHNQGCPYPARAKIRTSLPKGVTPKQFKNFIKKARTLGMIQTGRVIPNSDSTTKWIKMHPRWLKAAEVNTTPAPGIAAKVSTKAAPSVVVAIPRKITFTSASTPPQVEGRPPPTKYVIFVDCIRSHIRRGDTQPLQSAISSELVARHGSDVFLRTAGVVSFRKYLAMAERDCIVTRKGTKSGKWVRLRPETDWREEALTVPPLLETSSDTSGVEPTGPYDYAPLIERLRNWLVMKKSAQPSVSRIYSQLVNKYDSKIHPVLATKSAFDAYIAMAERNQIVILGGIGESQWMCLRPETCWRVKGDAATSCFSSSLTTFSVIEPSKVKHTIGGIAISAETSSSDVPLSVISQPLVEAEDRAIFLGNPTPDVLQQNCEVQLDRAGEVEKPAQNDMVSVSFKYRNLVEILQAHRECGTYYLSQADVFGEIRLRTGFSPLPLYATMAAMDGVVRIGGKTPDEWIALNPNLVGKSITFGSNSIGSAGGLFASVDSVDDLPDVDKECDLQESNEPASDFGEQRETSGVAEGLDAEGDTSEQRETSGGHDGFNAEEDVGVVVKNEGAPQLSLTIPDEKVEVVGGEVESPKSVRSVVGSWFSSLLQPLVDDA